MKVLLIPLALFLGCTNHHKVQRAISSVSHEQPPVEQGEVWGEEEVEYMTNIGDIFRDTLIKATGRNLVMRRDAHPKHHGCVTADLKIDNRDLPSDYKVGLFEKNRLYKTIIRFSNGDPDPKKSDTKADVRGMAVKILNVPYQNYLESIGVEDERRNHDLVFMNSDAFFIDNPEGYNKFMNATKGRFGVFGYLALHWVSLQRVLGAFDKPGNPLDLDYASATPYKLGATNMKMKFKTCKIKKDEVPENASVNFLGERLAEYLEQKEECYDFYVQPNKDPKRNDIEKSMVIWNEIKSPMIKVGRLTIDKQKGFRSESQMASCENMTFNPWRAHPENRPMGGVNRIRLEVYLNQSKLRHTYNGVK